MQYHNVFNRGMRLCSNGKYGLYGGSGPTSSLEHRAWRKARSDSGSTGPVGPCPAEIRPAALRVKARVYDLGPDTPRPVEHQRGRLGERGGAGCRSIGPGAPSNLLRLPGRLGHSEKVGTGRFPKEIVHFTFIRPLLDEMRQWRGNVTLVKVKSHIGCLLNERADEQGSASRTRSV